ncbi:cytosolic phospholipase A2 gamma [Danio aesculapii]|uniref:cytosolic phospholipase A2 gamma n=1 Tax=Danio aesculapii TaxID=1142201 RepID=UPI0024C0CD53|nr:cytosolic phospholipase A2 gamma [Danio aesculapii]
MSEEIPSEGVKVRISHSLNEAEINHVTNRRQSTLECLTRHGIQCSLDQVPNIALLGSGGSERAMVSLLESLYALAQTDLMDCMMYLAGISGSTWCMASLYKEPNWSKKLEVVKDDIIQKLVGPDVSLMDKYVALKEYYREKDNFSLTEVWAVLFISKMVKEIDESTFTSRHRSQHSKDPYPIYTVIDLQSKDDKLDADTFLEITPHETGVSITGAFVDSSSFGSQFKQGVKIKEQPEMDMLFLQGLCGSSLADPVKILEELIYIIKHLFGSESEMMADLSSSETKQTDIQSFSARHLDRAGKLLLTLVQVNLLVLKNEDPSSQVKTLNDLLRGKLDEDKYKKLLTKSKEMNKKTVKEYTVYVCNLQSYWDPTCNGIWSVIVKCTELVACWVWGTTYNFLHKMTEKEVSRICKHELRHYADGGIVINSPFLPVLRKERHIDLIISHDFNEDDPFESLTKTAEICKKLHIDFPEVPEEIKKEKDFPRDFYVLEGCNAPTVIHIPLFNRANCGSKAEMERLKRKYSTIQGPYSIEKIDELLEKAGLNITNNKENLLTVILNVIKHKKL